MHAKNWLIQLISTFREQTSKLSVGERAKISNLEDLSSPCQALMISFNETKHHIIIWMKNNNRPDVEIEAFQFSTSDALDTLQTILEDPKYDQKIPKEDRSMYQSAESFKDVLEKVFVGMIKKTQVELFVQTNFAGIPSKYLLTANSFVWDVYGNLGDLDPNVIARNIVENAKKEASKVIEKAESTASQTTSSQKDNWIKGFSTLFYPPIWVGKLPKISFRKKALGSYAYWSAKALTLSYKGKAIVINENGLIAIGERSRAKASRFLNEIMATFYLKGFSFRMAQEKDIGETTIDKESLDITIGPQMNSV